MSYRDLNSRWYHVSAIVVSCILVSIVMSVIGAAYTHAQVKESERREAAIKHDSDHRWCIISMVKRAALETAPLLTAEERVRAAVAKVTEGRTLTDDQKQWLGYVERHLVENLSIDREDFNLIPILSSRGGWRRANRVFDNHLAELLQSLNEELVTA